VAGLQADQVRKLHRGLLPASASPTFPPVVRLSHLGSAGFWPDLFPGEIGFLCFKQASRNLTMFGPNRLFSGTVVPQTVPQLHSIFLKCVDGHGSFRHKSGVLHGEALRRDLCGYNWRIPRYSLLVALTRDWRSQGAVTVVAESVPANSPAKALVASVARGRHLSTQVLITSRL
jgi:hypothetical protein